MIFTLNRDKSRRLIEGLTEPAIIVRGASVVMSNRAARNLLGVAIEGVDVRQVLPHPALIERLVRGRLTGPEEIEAAGFGHSRRQWLVRISPLGEGDLMVRLVPLGRTLPIGVATALLGAPFFLWLVTHMRWRLRA